MKSWKTSLSQMTGCRHILLIQPCRRSMRIFIKSSSKRPGGPQTESGREGERVCITGWCGWHWASIGLFFNDLSFAKGEMRRRAFLDRSYSMCEWDLAVTSTPTSKSATATLCAHTIYVKWISWLDLISAPHYLECIKQAASVICCDWPVICLSGRQGIGIAAPNFSSSRSYSQSKCLYLWLTALFVLYKKERKRKNMAIYTQLHINIIGQLSYLKKQVCDK